MIRFIFFCNPSKSLITWVSSIIFFCTCYFHFIFFIKSTKKDSYLFQKSNIFNTCFYIIFIINCLYSFYIIPIIYSKKLNFKNLRAFPNLTEGVGISLQFLVPAGFLAFYLTLSHSETFVIFYNFHSYCKRA